MLCENGSTRLVVLSHPNHELAIFGLLQRFRPYFVYLTDGGGDERVAQTRRGLESIGLLERARFLNHPEKSFYGALLECDSAFYERVACQVRASVEVLQPEQIFCDAIEFYNPVHDMSLPIVKAALLGQAGASLFEAPLVYQTPAEAETYEVQRMPASRRHEEIELRLSEQELAAKVQARDKVYTMLTDQMGSVISQLPRAHLAREVVAPARSCLTAPGPDVALRYEWRAERLMERGEIERKISFAQHYLPVASALLKVSADSPRATA